jgi:hypothetical protein
MIEAAAPRKRVHGVAPGTVCGKPRTHVVRRSRKLIVVPVAPDARDRDPHILVLRGTWVAGLTVDRCVPTQKREPRLLVLLDHICNLPGQSRMATEAVYAQFTPMDVGVTRETIRFHFGKLQVLVT